MCTYSTNGLKVRILTTQDLLNECPFNAPNKTLLIRIVCFQTRPVID